MAAKPFLDRAVARVLAAFVVALCGALLAYLHRDDIQPALGWTEAPAAKSASKDPALPCIEQRFAEIDAMIDDGIVKAGQAAKFKERAEAMCRATNDEGAGPSLPIN
ncbi:MAG: hypothetical protein AAFO01_09735 [Pseudomonadota bacterium]